MKEGMRVLLIIICMLFDLRIGDTKSNSSEKAKLQTS